MACDSTAYLPVRMGRGFCTWSCSRSPCPTQTHACQPELARKKEKKRLPRKKEKKRQKRCASYVHASTQNCAGSPAEQNPGRRSTKTTEQQIT
eukprot:2273925-Rhodomonas_salina.2